MPGSGSLMIWDLINWILEDPFPAVILIFTIIYVVYSAAIIREILKRPFD
jgi:hypothetical protein